MNPTTERTPVTQPATPWPNQQPVPDGITPTDQVPQDRDLFTDEDLQDEEGPA